MFVFFNGESLHVDLRGFNIEQSIFGCFVIEFKVEEKSSLYFSLDKKSSRFDFDTVSAKADDFGAPSAGGDIKLQKGVIS